MVENTTNTTKPNIMVLGTLGTGKSTLMNRLHGGDTNVFDASYSEFGVTQKPEIIELENFTLIDTPGLNDPKIPTADWSTRFNSSEVTTNEKRIALSLLVFK